jgi:prepilin-type processing-associated H-X9-DG protein
VFIDEHEDTIDNSLFGLAIRMLGPETGWNFNLPASRHLDSAVLSFADGHVESHRWRDPRTLKPVNGSPTVDHSPDNKDTIWLFQRATIVEQASWAVP